MNMSGTSNYSEHCSIRGYTKTTNVKSSRSSDRKSQNQQTGLIFHTMSLNDRQKAVFNESILSITEIKPDYHNVRQGYKTKTNTGKSQRKTRSLSYPGKLNPYSFNAQEKCHTKERLLICRACQEAYQNRNNRVRYYGNERTTRKHVDECSRARKQSTPKDTFSNLAYAGCEHTQILNNLHELPLSSLKKENNCNSSPRDSPTLDCNSNTVSAVSYNCNGVKKRSSPKKSTFHAMTTSTGQMVKVVKEKDSSDTKATETKKRDLSLTARSTETYCESRSSKSLQGMCTSATLPLPVIQQNGTHAGENQNNSFARRLSKMIEVDGVNYMVTMEPPRSPNYRPGNKSPSQGDAKDKRPLKQNTNPQSANPVSNGIRKVSSNDLFKVAPNKTSQQLDCWYDQRLKKSKVMDVNHCGSRDIVDPDKTEALDHAALRLRNLVSAMTRGTNLPKEVLQQNLEYAISVLESSYLKATSKPDYLATADDEMLENLSGEAPVPQEIKSWLVETFSKKRVAAEKKRPHGERQRFRCVAKAIHAGIAFGKFGKPLGENGDTALPREVELHLQNVDKWSFDVFELDRISNGNALRYTCYKLLTKYDLIRKFKIPVPVLFAYCNRLQIGYNKHGNRYHNPCHAADVAQTLNCLLVHTGLVNWFSDLEIFSMIMAAIIHDLEHTGTTNNFHIHTRSNLALLYNDKSVLENHHVSAAFQLLKEKDCDVLANFSKEDYQDCRSLMIEMVLATDMKQHLEQVQRMEAALQCPDVLEKSKTMCMLIHASDINHPSKPWPLHHQWTKRLMFEFFDQGDREREESLPLSPLCDRHSARVAQSQISFIEFVVQPTFSTLLRVFSAVNGPTVRSALEAQNKQNGASSDETSSIPNDILKFRFCDVPASDEIMKNFETTEAKLANFQKLCFACTDYNKSQWIKKDVIEREKSLLGESAFTDAGKIIEDTLPSIIQKDLDSNLSIENPSAENGLLKRTLQGADVPAPT